MAFFGRFLLEIPSEVIAISSEVIAILSEVIRISSEVIAINSENFRRKGHFFRILFFNKKK